MTEYSASCIKTTWPLRLLPSLSQKHLCLRGPAESPRTLTHTGERLELSARLSPTSSLQGPSQSPLSTTFNTETPATPRSSGPSKKRYGLSETISRLHGSRVLEEKSVSTTKTLRQRLRSSLRL